MKAELTTAQQAVVDRTERFGVLRLRPWERRLRRVVDRLVQKGVLRFSAMVNGWVTTSAYDQMNERVEAALARVEEGRP